MKEPRKGQFYIGQGGVRGMETSWRGGRETEATWGTSRRRQECLRNRTEPMRTRWMTKEDSREQRENRADLGAFRAIVKTLASALGEKGGALSRKVTKI